jgi:uncharacterized CHY-type Zn-finger protein
MVDCEKWYKKYDCKQSTKEEEIEKISWLTTQKKKKVVPMFLPGQFLDF